MTRQAGRRTATGERGCAGRLSELPHGLCGHHTAGPTVEEEQDEEKEEGVEGFDEGA